jgi:hypothetical protein
VLDPGDYVICAGCAYILVLDEKCTPRTITLGEWSEVLQDSELYSELKTNQRRIAGEIHPPAPEN